VVCIHHTRDSIESETIKHEVVHIVTEIRQEEPQDLVIAIIEQPRTPLGMVAPGSSVKVLMISAVEFVDTGSLAIAESVGPTRRGCFWTHGSEPRLEGQ
jgi:hypothetical protein